MVTKIESTRAPAASPSPPSPVQVESMDALTREAATMQSSENATADKAAQANQQAESGQRQAQASAAVSEITQVLGVVRNMAANMADATGLLPRAKTMEIWSDAQLGDLAMPLLAVMERHGSQVNEFFQRYGPYVMLIGAAAMPAIATVKAMREHKAITVPSRVVEPAPGPAKGGTGG